MGKVLSKRLRTTLAETVSSVQGAFVKGCQILDAVLVANEAVEENRVLKKECVVFKADFEKAYDHVDWHFLDFVMSRKGFGERWRRCLSTCNMSVIVNVKSGNSFRVTWGLRQGVPLSSFLFILVADVLGRFVDRAREIL